MTQQTQWGPRTAGITGCAVAGALLAVSAVTLATDLPGRLLAGIAGVGLMAFAAASWRARPRLAITADGLRLRGPWRSRLLTRPEVGAVRITEFARIGRKQRLLEIESRDGGLTVLSRWDLGVDPLDVLDALTAAGYAGR